MRTSPEDPLGASLPKKEQVSKESLGSRLRSWFTGLACFSDPATEDFPVAPSFSFMDGPIEKGINDPEAIRRVRRALNGPEKLKTEAPAEIPAAVKKAEAVKVTRSKDAIIMTTVLADLQPKSAPASCPTTTPNCEKTEQANVPACATPRARKPSKWAPQYQGYIGKNAWELSLRKYRQPAPTGLPTPRRLSATPNSSPRAVGNLPGSPKRGPELIKATRVIKA